MHLGGCPAMTTDMRGPLDGPSPADVGLGRRVAFIGVAMAGTAALIGFALRAVPAAAIVAVNLGVLGMIVAGFGIARRPKDSLTLLTGSATALLASLATHPDWDSIRLMQ